MLDKLDNLSHHPLPRILDEYLNLLQPQFQVQLQQLQLRATDPLRVLRQGQQLEGFSTLDHHHLPHRHQVQHSIPV